jgi:hypothetical protein
MLVIILENPQSGHGFSRIEAAQVHSTIGATFYQATLPAMANELWVGAGTAVAHLRFCPYP